MHRLCQGFALQPLLHLRGEITLVDVGPCRMSMLRTDSDDDNVRFRALIALQGAPKQLAMHLKGEKEKR